MRASRLPSLVLVAVAASAACADDAKPSDLALDVERPGLPSRTQFMSANVSLFLERRCGSLDCHGRPERPLKIVGPGGLRSLNDAGLVPTSSVRTEVEQLENFYAVVGLEPEVLSRVLAARTAEECRLPGESTGRPPMMPELGPERCLHRLLLLSKPLGCGPSSHGCTVGVGVEHKGGPVISLDTDGYHCLVKWLRGAADATSCTRAAVAAAPGDGGPR